MPPCLILQLAYLIPLSLSINHVQIQFHLFSAPLFFKPKLFSCFEVKKEKDLKSEDWWFLACECWVFGMISSSWVNVGKRDEVRIVCEREIGGGEGRKVEIGERESWSFLTSHESGEEKAYWFAIRNAAVTIHSTTGVYHTQLSTLRSQYSTSTLHSVLRSGSPSCPSRHASRPTATVPSPVPHTPSSQASSGRSIGVNVW